MHCPWIFYSRNGFGAIIAIRFYILVCVTTYNFTHVLHVCLCVKAVGVFGYKVSCTFLFVDIRINHLSTNHSYAVVGTCSDKEILDALPQSPYSFICFCIAHEDFPELNVEDSEEFSDLYEAVMMDAHNDARNYLNEDLMQIDKRVIIFVQGGTPVIHLFVKWLLPVFQQIQHRLKPNQSKYRWAINTTNMWYQGLLFFNHSLYDIEARRRTYTHSFPLTHCGLMTSYGGIDWVNIGSGNGLLPDGTKPLPEPMLTYHPQDPLTFIWCQFHKRYISHQWLKLTWKLLF